MTRTNWTRTSFENTRYVIFKTSAQGMFSTLFVFLINNLIFFLPLYAQKMMDSELFQDSSLAETFEWTAEGRTGGADDDVDVDMNLLKNLMEAQSQGMGSPLAGPLGQLMAQLGIKMPMPPPMKQRP